MTKPPTAKPGAKPPTIPKGKPPSAPKTGSSTPKKKFKITDWDAGNSGEKIIIYGPSGIGKTSLCSLLGQDAVWIGSDDGGRKVRDPDGNKLRVVPGIETYQDVRDALHQKGLFDDGKHIVVDTLTRVEEWKQPHIMATIKQGGKTVTSFRKYGWDGDRHILDHHRYLMSDLDAHCAAGRNIILLCQQGQIKRSSAETADFLEDGPFLQHRNDCSAREEWKQWADHVFRIGYLDLQVEVAKGKQVGKVVSEDETRAIFGAGSLASTAKTRPVNGYKLPPVISFESEEDGSLWQYLFEGCVAPEPDDSEE